MPCSGIMDPCMIFRVDEKSCYELDWNLQGALDMALRVINDIVSFQEELEAQAYNEVCNGSLHHYS